MNTVNSTDSIDSAFFITQFYNKNISEFTIVFEK